MKKSILVDASVAVHFIIGKNESIVLEVKKLFDLANNHKLKILAPSFLQIEVANALRFSLTDEMKQFENLEEFFQLGITFIEPTKVNIFDALNRSQIVNDTVYDALYHVLAQAHEATFITCDRKYFERAKMYGDIELI